MLLTSGSNTFGNGTSSDRLTAAADAHYGAAVTWDYYKTTHNRNGIANDGKGRHVARALRQQLQQRLLVGRLLLR